MRYLITDVSSENVVEKIYKDPPAEPGTVQDALSNTLISRLDPAPMTEAEADRVLAAEDRCTFNRSPETHPILWTSRQGDAAAMKLNGVLISLEPTDAGPDGGAAFSAPGVNMSVRPLGDEGGWR